MALSALQGDQQVGQRLMVGFNGTTLTAELEHAIGSLHVGGIILFSRNIESPAQVASLCHSAQSFAARCGEPPLFVAIDQEGGVVARLRPPFTQFAGNPAMKTPADAVRFARITARELVQIGVNMNMAPVLDVTPVHGAGIMRQRVFGSDPQWVSRMGRIVIDELQTHGVMAVGKHFPGIGRTVLDSHMDLPDLDITPETLAGRDLIPFQAAIQSRVGGIMLSHIRYRRIDPRWPASLSKPIAHDLLRHAMGYGGLAMTDDLDMGAIAKHYDLEDIVTQCLGAWVDILLICHAGPKIEAAWKLIKRGLDDSETAAWENEAAIQRILTAKERFIQPTTTKPSP